MPLSDSEAPRSWAEEELGRRWDTCLADTIMKIGSGVAVGGILSLLVFKRRPWPLFLGLGFGIGTSYCHCERRLNEAVAGPLEPSLGMSSTKEKPI